MDHFVGRDAFQFFVYSHRQRAIILGKEGMFPERRWGEEIRCLTDSCSLIGDYQVDILPEGRNFFVMIVRNECISMFLRQMIRRRQQ